LPYISVVLDAELSATVKRGTEFSEVTRIQLLTCRAPYQDKFRSVVAKVVVTHVVTVDINSIKEVTTTRQLSRQLLSTAVEIDFSVRVTDVVAGAALVSSGALAKDKLDAELVKQVCVLVFMRVNIKYVCTYTYITCEHKSTALALVCIYV